MKLTDSKDDLLLYDISFADGDANDHHLFQNWRRCDDVWYKIQALSNKWLLK